MLRLDSVKIKNKVREPHTQGVPVWETVGIRRTGKAGVERSLPAEALRLSEADKRGEFRGFRQASILNQTRPIMGSLSISLHGIREERLWHPAL